MGGKNRVEIEYIPVAEIIPYAKNPRKNDKAVDIVLKSIKEFGFKNPIILDKNNEIVAGHTRLKAAIKLEMTEVPIIWADDLTDEQVKAFRIMDNKSHEYAEWDNELLREEIDILESEGFDVDLTGFKDDELLEDYSRKIKSPVYEIMGKKPKMNELIDTEKTDKLIKKIEESELDDSIKNFLRFAAYRHTVFNYENIAEYYAHSTKELQELMEDSALIIIDYKKAVEDGFIRLSENLAGKFLGQGDEE